MRFEWRECSLGELLNIKHGFAFSGEHISKNQGKRVLVTPGNFEIGGGFKEGNAKYFHGPYPEEYVFAPGDLIVTMTDLSKTADTLGYSAKIPREECKIYLHNQRVGKVIAKSSDANLDFLYWVMRHKDYRSLVVSTATGSTARHTSPSRILAYSFLLPPPSQQQAIAHILGTLDDKIELNRKTNETLEAMAKALFKSWFVDFVPVRAKAEGRPTGLPAEISGLFPDSFEDSELGEIPSGWCIDSIYAVASVVYGAPFSSSLFNGDGSGIPVARIRDLPGESPGVYTTEVHTKGTLILPGDIVVGMDGEFRAYLWGGEECWMNQRVCKFIPGQKGRTCFVRESIRKPLMDVEMSETATTVIHLGKGDIDGFRVVVPTQEILDIFSAATTPLYEEVVANKQQTRVLANIRDALLPKLISGEIRIPDAEKMLEEVGV